MKLENGVYTTPCKVNGLQLRFIFDTGASNVCLSLSEAIFMLKNGYLEESDVHGSSKSQIANGDIVNNTTITIKELEIGNIKLHDIDALVIHELTAPLLLGQSAIQKLGKIQIEGDELVILNGSPSTDGNACIRAEKLLEEAINYDNRNLVELSAKTFLEAYDLCPDVFTCNDINIMGFILSRCENYKKSIVFLEKSAKCIDNKYINILWRTYFFLGSDYSHIGDFENSIINAQKALLYANSDLEFYNCYALMGYTYQNQNKSQEEYNVSLKAEKYYLKYISKTGDEVLSGKVKDFFLGDLYYSLIICCANLGYPKEADFYAIKAALCGNQKAIEYCDKFGLPYKRFKE